MGLTQEQIDKIPLEIRQSMVSDILCTQEDKVLADLVDTMLQLFKYVTPSTVCTLGLAAKLGTLQKLYDPIHEAIDKGFEQYVVEQKASEKASEKVPAKKRAE